MPDEKRTARPLAHRIAVRTAHVLFERGQLDTAPRRELSELGLDADDRQGYAPTGWFFLRRALRGVRIGAEDVFVDFGSGMGRVVLHVARRYPARRVVGIELAPDLTSVAQQNLARQRERLRCRDVELVTGDVATFTVPDDMTVAYLYNPFTDDLFRTVLTRIGQSLDRAPRDLTLVYVNPQMAADVVATGRFVHVRTSRPRRASGVDRWASTYRSMRQ
jgi:SAM-dependent methyltransferase